MSALEKKLARDVAKLRGVLVLLRSACDKLMGDSDLDEDDSTEMKAMLAAAKVLAATAPKKPRG